MNKKIILAGLLALATMCGTIGVHHSTNAESETAAVTALLNEYRHNGYYTKHTDIHITDKAVEELMKNNGFHQTSQLERTTYYTPDALWMSRESGKGYSYYGSNGKDLTNATTNDPLVAPENAGIALKYGADTSTGKWHDEVGGMEGYYYTLKDIANTDANLWTENGGIYSSENASVIDLFKAFCAPCYLGFTKDTNNYIDLVKAEIQETTNGLELRLIAKCEDGKIEDNGTVFATATVTKRHNISQELSKDEHVHYNACEYCDEKINAEEHKGGTPTCTKEAVCTTCNESYGEKSAHNFNKQIANANTLAKAATCTSKATYYYTCECGEKGTNTFESGNALGHSGGTATTTAKAKCSTCKQEYGETLTKITVYFSAPNDSYWGDNTYIYLWDSKNNGWPGVKMTYDSTNDYGQKVYKYEVDYSTYKNCIFNNGNGWQSEDVSLDGRANKTVWYFTGDGNKVGTSQM